MTNVLKLIKTEDRRKEDIAEIVQEIIEDLPNIDSFAAVYKDKDGFVQTCWAGGWTLEICGMAHVLVEAVLLRMKDYED